MKIQPINLINNKQNKIQQQNQKQNIQTARPTYPLPTSAHYVSFLGGYSLSLSQTVQNLDKLGAKFPPDIKTLAEQEIAQGNSQDKTLIDIHKSKYEGLNSCNTLDEAKQMYPEFEGIFSDSELEHKENSFIWGVKAGNSKNFSQNEDVALQLLKLYWAEGFSLSDLSKHADGKNLYYSMQKLNIPLMDRNYAHILKFSDKEYNERITKTMVEKRQEAMLAAIANGTFFQKEHYSRAPLSDEHKKHISEGLIKYYNEHPEALAEMSAREKEYWENNPHQRQLMTRVTTEAWQTRDGKKIKKKMVKFFATNNAQINDKELENPFSMNKTQQELLALFWKKNAWAPAKFSKAMKTAWDKVKKEEEKELVDNSKIPVDPKFHCNIIPTKVMEDGLNWARKQGKDVSGLNVEDVRNLNITPKQERKYNAIMLDYMESLGGKIYDSSLTDINLIAMRYIAKEIENDKLPESVHLDKEFAQDFKDEVERLYGKIKNFGQINATEVHDSIIHFTNYATQENQEDFCPYYSKKVDEAYESVASFNNYQTKHPANFAQFPKKS